ncbi:MAG: sulfite exporter TauE/SafE family protein [Holophaga sp.]|nr:sulfite exporter TauE/SafE family protein [Holophaga sp.]
MNETTLLFLAGVALLAGVVNGVLGHGFSSLLVPPALLVVASRVLNPVLVLVEVVLNLGSLFASRSHLKGVLPGLRPTLLGLLPGTVIGASMVALLPVLSLKLATYCVLFPLVLLQASGFTWQALAHRLARFPFGLATGIVYGATTISGPMLSLYFQNAKTGREEYRASVAALRVTESLLTAIIYLMLGLYTRESLEVAKWLAPAGIIGLGLGIILSKLVREKVFKRFCITFNVFALGIGFARLLEAVDPQRRMLFQALWIIPLSLVLLRQSTWMRRMSLGNRLLQRRLDARANARRALPEYQI